MTKPLPFIVTALLTLGACVGTPPVSADAGPGTRSADPRTAAEVFTAACIRTLPDFAGTPFAIAQFPMTQNMETGTYFHNDLDLSVKLIGDDCSIVFSIVGDPVDGITAFGVILDRLTPDPDITVTLDARSGPNGRVYVNARTTRSQ